MKYSNECRRLAQLLVTFRDSTLPLDGSSRDPLKSYKDLIVDLHSYDPNIKEKICELLKYQYHPELMQQILDWPVPRFPVSAGMLILKGIKQGPNYKLIINELREAWKKSHYGATESQLLDETLPLLLKNLSAAENLATVNQKTFVNPPAFALPKRRKLKESAPDPATVARKAWRDKKFLIVCRLCIYLCWWHEIKNRDIGKKSDPNNQVYSPV